MNNYPEHEKLEKISSKSQTIGEFLEDLKEKNIFLCSYNKKREKFIRVDQSTVEFLADYFGINLDRLEKEKLEMLAGLREMNQAK